MAFMECLKSSSLIDGEASETNTIRILHVESSDVERDILLKSIEERGLYYDVDQADGIKEAAALLEKGCYDIVLSDYYFSDGSWPMLLAYAVDMPVIVIVESGKESLAVKAIRHGAGDYIIRDEAGGYLELLPLVIDRVFAVRQLEIESNKADEAMIRTAKMASLGEFGAGIAHELNSPLAGILSLTEVMMNRVGENDSNYLFLAKIKDAVLRSKSIVKDLLTYSMYECAERQLISVNDVVDSTISFFAALVKKESINIKKELPEGLPYVKASESHLSELFLNLMKNAKDSLDGNGTITLRTMVESAQGGEIVVVEVEDNGCGIPSEIRHKIFEPFFTTKSATGGVNVGLGLSICKKIVETLGGSIEVRDAFPKGTLFRIRLPAETVTSERTIGAHDLSSN